ncbi:MAG: hypothetical protein ACFFDN_01975 [Candidatus Hodarchaeota archaeon]
MTKTQAILDSIAHWKRMIAWAEKEKSKKVCSYYMLEQLGESPEARYCALCKLFYEREIFECSIKCPLRCKYGKCGKPGSLNAYQKPFLFNSWKSWAKAVKKMVEQLESLL